VRVRFHLVVVVAALFAFASACGGNDGPGDPQSPAASGSTGPAVTTDSSTSFHPVAGNFEPDDTKLSTCAGAFPCLEQAFGNLVHEDGPKRGFEVLAEALRDMPGVEADCHRIVHTMGSAALARYDGDVARTFSEGDSACNSGYYHGILERAFAGASSKLELQSRATDVCRAEKIRLTQWLNFSCLHGLGHGLMIQTGMALPTALEICEGLDARWDRDVCAGGAFMENFFSTYGVDSKFVKSDDLVYPCNAELISDDFRVACYLIVTARILAKTGNDWRETARICGSVHTDYRDICFESFGRDASGASNHEPRKIATLCQLTGAGQRACFFGAGRELTSNDANPDRSSALCRLARADDRSWCFHGIGTIIGSMHSGDPAERRRLCREAARDYAAQCLEGAASELANRNRGAES
jgi:hypothetical protein